MSDDTATPHQPKVMPADDGASGDESNEADSNDGNSKDGEVMDVNADNLAFPMRLTARERLFQAAWVNMSIAIAVFIVVSAVQLAEAAGIGLGAFLTRDPFTLGLFLPTVAFSAWSITAGVQTTRSWNRGRIAIHGTRLHYTRPGISALSRRAQNVIFELKNAHRVVLLPTKFKCQLELTYDKIALTLPLHRALVNDQHVSEPWLEHALVRAIDLRAPVDILLVDSDT